MHMQSTPGGAAVAVSVPGLMLAVEHAPQRNKSLFGSLLQSCPFHTDPPIVHNDAQDGARA